MSAHQKKIIGGPNEGYGWKCQCAPNVTMSKGKVFPSKGAATAAWETHRTEGPK